MTDIFAGKTGETSRSTTSRSANRSRLTSFTTNSLESLRTWRAGRAACSARTYGSGLSLKERERIWSRAFFGSALRGLQRLQEGSHIGWWSWWSRVARSTGVAWCSGLASFSRTSRSANLTLGTLMNEKNIDFLVDNQRELKYKTHH